MQYNTLKFQKSNSDGGLMFENKDKLDKLLLLNLVGEFLVVGDNVERPFDLNMFLSSNCNELKLLKELTLTIFLLCLEIQRCPMHWSIENLRVGSISSDLWIKLCAEVLMYEGI